MSNAFAVTNPGGMGDGAAVRKQPGYVRATKVVSAGSGYTIFDTLTNGVAAMKRLLRNEYLVRNEYLALTSRTAT